jgi:hypothetical protein
MLSRDLGLARLKIVGDRFLDLLGAFAMDGPCT